MIAFMSAWSLSNSAFRSRSLPGITVQHGVKIGKARFALAEVGVIDS